KTAAIAQMVSVPDGWSSNLPFSAPVFDSGGWWNGSSPTRLTVPAGVNYVQVTASVELSYTCTVCNAFLVKNDDTIVGWSYGATANTGIGSAAFTVMAPVLKVSPGDFFTVRTSQNSGGALWSAVHFSVVGLDPGAGSATALKTASLDQSVNVPNGWG